MRIDDMFDEIKVVVFRDACKIITEKIIDLGICKDAVMYKQLNELQFADSETILKILKGD